VKRNRSVISKRVRCASRASWDREDGNVGGSHPVMYVTKAICHEDARLMLLMLEMLLDSVIMGAADEILGIACRFI
jgi:hypothetical protein